MTTTTTSIRTLIDAGLISGDTCLSAADQQAIGDLSRDELDAIIAMRCRLGRDVSKQDGHVPSVIF